MGVNSKRTVGIVGAGLGGLSAAVHLAAAGHEVSVYEKQSGPGGKAFTEKQGDYRFDTGPSLVTMPEVFDRLFAVAGKRRADYLHFIPLNPICRYFFDDGSRFEAPPGPETFTAEARRIFGEPPEHLEHYFGYSRRIYEITHRLFLERSLHEGSTYRSADFRRSLFRIGQIDALRTMDRAHRRFFDDPRLVQLFDRYATYNGSSPYRTPATLNIIPHVEYAFGGYAVDGGIYAIPTAIERLAKEVGVRLHYGVTVEAIEYDDTNRHKQVRGLCVNGSSIPFDVVVSNADVSPTYERLLNDPQAPLLRRYRSLEPSSSGLVFYWGMNRRFPELGVNNIFFSGDYGREFEEIFDQGTCPTDPTVYVNITSKVTPGDAPSGGENWFVLVNAPASHGQNWETETAHARRAVLRRLGRALGGDIGSCIEVESTLTPPEIEARTDSRMGSLYGIASNTKLAAFLRHPNRSTRYRGLYLVGGSAHPGGGMPLVILGGKIVADLVAIHEVPHGGMDSDADEGTP